MILFEFLYLESKDCINNYPLMKYPFMDKQQFSDHAGTLLSVSLISLIVAISREKICNNDFHV